MSSDDQRLTRRRVRRLAAAHAISTAGSQAAQIAVVYAVYRTTRSSAWVIAALAASISATGAMGPVAGWVADRFDRRRVMTASEIGAGAVYLLMVLAHAPLALVLGTLAAAVAGSPFRAASVAAVPNLVTTDDLAWANGQLGAAFNIALVAGPIIGGALVAASGPRIVFAVNAATFLFSAVLIVTTQGRFGGHACERPDPDRGSLLAGFRRIGGSRRLGLLTAASSLAFGAFGSALVIDPALAVHFHAGSVGYGLLTSTWGGGAVVGSLAAGRLVAPARAPAAIVAGLVVMAASLGAIPLLPTFGLIVAAGAIGGVGSGGTFVPWLVVIQHEVADALRGRVVAATESLNQLLFLAGMAVATPALSALGPHRAYGLTGGILALGALAGVAAVAAPGSAPQRAPSWPEVVAEPIRTGTATPP